jgi:hypothetical protein
VAWVREAISAAAVSAMVCDEIYFRRDGVLGAAMVIGGGDSPYGGALEKFREELGAAIEKNGRPRAVFEAMVLAKPVLTYTKDPATGKVTFHGRRTGAPGEVVLSDEKDTLAFNAGNSLDCGFSKGTADTGAELAPLLGLKEWLLIAGANADESSAGRAALARAMEKVLAWDTVCPPCISGRMGDSGVEQVRRALEDLRAQLAEPAKPGD